MNRLSATPLNYIIYRTSENLIVDGKAEETDWMKAPWSAYFVDIEGAAKSSPKYSTRVKMLWSSQYFFIYAELEEPHIWAMITEHDKVVYHDNDFEIFIDPDGDSYQYFEIELNALKTVFDLFMSKPYRNGGLALIPWNAEGLKVEVAVEGTLNDPSDIDKKWTLEVAIPFKAISLGNHVQVPEEGTLWRVNFSRVEWDVEVKNGSYHKKTDPETSKPLSEHNWVWSPQGVINMHLPERWGYVRFSTHSAGDPKAEFNLPDEENLKNHLWQIYYSQADHFRLKGKYAPDLRSLKLEDDQQLDREIYKIEMESTSRQYQVELKSNVSNDTWTINQEGQIRKMATRNTQ